MIASAIRPTATGVTMSSAARRHEEGRRSWIGAADPAAHRSTSTRSRALCQRLSGSFARHFHKSHSTAGAVVTLNDCRLGGSDASIAVINAA
jgi:hypothetical protein